MVLVFIGTKRKRDRNSLFPTIKGESVNKVLVPTDRQSGTSEYDEIQMGG